MKLKEFIERKKEIIANYNRGISSYSESVEKTRELNDQAKEAGLRLTFQTFDEVIKKQADLERLQQREEDSVNGDSDDESYEESESYDEDDEDESYDD